VADLLTLLATLVVLRLEVEGVDEGGRDAWDRTQESERKERELIKSTHTFDFFK
jgi:hypothetical protein